MKKNLPVGTVKAVRVSPWGFDMKAYGTYDPEDPPSFDVSAVYVGDVDIFDMLDNQQLSVIEDHCIRQLEDRP